MSDKSAPSGVEFFLLAPPVSDDLAELSRLEAVAERFKARLIQFELDFFRRVLRRTFAEVGELEAVIVEVGRAGFANIYLEGDLGTASRFEEIRRRLQSALARDAVHAAAGLWTSAEGPIRRAGMFIDSLA